MTGYFLRVQRDGHWQPVEIDQMTDDELEAWAERMRRAREKVPSIVDGFSWAIALAQWIRDHVGEPQENPP